MALRTITASPEAIRRLVAVMDRAKQAQDQANAVFDMFVASHGVYTVAALKALRDTEVDVEIPDEVAP